jgi:hypothetical protein
MFVGACLWKVGGLPTINNLAPQQTKLEVRESYMRSAAETVTAAR